MGNVPSTEAGPGKEQRASHKLSKPRTGNPTAAGLLSPGSVSTPPSARVSYKRRSSLPYSYSPASPSALSVVEDAAETAAEQDESQPEPEPQPQRPKMNRERSFKALFRSKSSNATPKYRERKDSAAEPAMPVNAGRPSRANSMINDPGSMHHLYTAGHPLSLSTAGSRTSINYNMTSYEAKRLLGLMEEPTFEDYSHMSESHAEVSAATWKSSNPHNPNNEPPSTTAPISRAHSDVSLYTPMRRRSFIMTPGLATRSSRANSMGGRNAGRYSLPPTPARRDSIDSEPPLMLSIPPPNFENKRQSPVETPSDTDYSKLGAFKFGSLRITNGSPTRSPAIDRNEDDDGSSESATKATRKDYFAGKPASTAPKAVEMKSKAVDNRFAKALSNKVTRSTTTAALSTAKAITASSNLSPELQTTSKHTAEQDDLFEEEIHDPEVLDIRVDPNAKALPPRPKLKSETGVRRADSGLVVSPTSEYSHQSLAKADSGYSSNVSLRSFSAKVKAKATGRGKSDALESEGPSPAPTKNTIVVPLSSPSSDGTPPPVPAKDEPSEWPMTSVPSREPSSSSSRQRLTLRTSASLSRKTRNALAPITGRRSVDEVLPSPVSRTISPTSPATPNSALSIGSGDSKKPSKLQRLLTGSKSALSVHVTHPSDNEVLVAGIPPVPQDIEAKLRHHSGRFPLSMKRLALKPEPSRDTLKTILSVGSLDVSLDEGLKVFAEKDSALVKDKKQPLDLQGMGSSLAQAAASVLSSRKSITRKPVPIRSIVGRNAEKSKAAEPEAVLTDSEVMITSFNIGQTRVGESAFDTAFLAMSTERQPCHSPTEVSSVVPSRSPQESVEAIAALKANQSVARIPPPVSMRTRRSSNFHVPAPLRPKSTPPGATGSQSLSKKSSRENIYSYPAAQQQIPALGATLSRRTSREAMYKLQYNAHELQQDNPVPHTSKPPMISRRSMTFITQKGNQHRVPNWDIMTDHGSLPNSERSSFDHSIRNAWSNQLGNSDSFGPSVQRPITAQPYQQPNIPSLRHYQSCDDYSQQQLDGYHPPPGLYSAMLEANGQQVVTDSGCSRAHYRHKSTGTQDPNSLPYRVLHSYNSPAYRNAPIWG